MQKHVKTDNLMFSRFNDLDRDFKMISSLVF